MTYNVVENSKYSNCSSTATGLTGTPVSPINLIAEATSNLIVDLTWTDKSSNEKGFKIYRKSGSSAWVLLTKTDPNISHFSDTTAIKNSSMITYQYYVSAFNEFGNSPSSNAAIIPYQPTYSHAGSGIPFAFGTNLVWIDKSSNATGFEIFRKTGSCNSTYTWSKIATLGANTSVWTDTENTNDYKYSYKIRSYTKIGSILPAYGYSLYSNCFSATDF
jgi:hypothetical protein